MQRIVILICLAIGFSPALAQTSPAVVVLPDGSALSVSPLEIRLEIGLSARVPFRVYTVGSPRRLIIDLPTTDWRQMPRDLASTDSVVSGIRFGIFRPDQGRLVLDLAVPFKLSSAQFSGDAVLTVVLERTDDAGFSAASLAPENSRWTLQDLRPLIDGENGLPLVALDAGHGGIDPGAVRGEITEKDVTLAFVQTLRDALLASGRYRVLLTRDDDRFLTLSERIRLARASGTDIFLSFHANTVERGKARGIAVYNLSEAASSDEAAQLAEYENRSDILAGVSFDGEEDELTRILVELAQRETNARSGLFADILAAAILPVLDPGVRSRRMAASLRVLRAPDTPSALVEIGFISSKADLDDMTDPVWRDAANAAIISAIDQWLKLTE